MDYVLKILVLILKTKGLMIQRYATGSIRASQLDSLVQHQGQFSEFVKWKDQHGRISTLSGSPNTLKPGSREDMETTAMTAQKLSDTASRYEVCIQNDGFCFQNDESCITNVELCTTNAAARRSSCGPSTDIGK